MFNQQQTIGFVSDPDHDTDPGIFKGIFTVAGYDNSTNFVFFVDEFLQIS